MQACDFRHLMVTSRAPPPESAVWDRYRRITPTPITPDDVPLFIQTYAPGAEDLVTKRIAALVAREPLPSPLFLRFAIEQAAAGELASTDKVDLVLHYVEALRAGRVDVSRDDMRRASSLAAVEAVRETGNALQIERLRLRSVLQTEADRMPYMDAANAEEVSPAALIDRLVSAGLLNETRPDDRLQFAYDPVAEYLAARWLEERAEFESLRLRLLATPNAVAAAYGEITGEVATATA